MNYLKCFEEFENKAFLGYHSSRMDFNDGYYKGNVLDVNQYSDLIRNIYIEIISDYDKNIEKNNILGMNKRFQKDGYKFTFVSKSPIDASNFQHTKYKYGNYLYKVYGDDSEILFDDPNEINATIVITKKPLFFEKVL